jgi:large subunit ribosomal protein L28
MARVCELTGKGPVTGNLVSHSNIKTRTRWLPNLQRKRFKVSELGQILTVRLSTHAIHTIDKVGGISNAIRKAKDENLSEQLLRVKRSLIKQAKNQGSKK